MGPFTHPYVNMRALGRARKLAREGDARLNRELLGMLTSSRDVERLFIYAGNSADVISAYHIINRQFSAYDYAHNNNPDDVSGVPNFGYSLVDECRPNAGGGERWLSREDYVRDFAIACGWVSHQIADWYWHYACVDRDGRLCEREDERADGITTFPGYSNSHRIFGADYPVPFLERYGVIDHGLLEFFVDILMLAEDSTGVLENVRVKLFGPRRPPYPNLLTAVSEKFGRQARIPPEDIDTLERDMNLVIAGMRILIELVRVRCPSLCRDISSIVNREYIDRAVDRVVDHLFRKDFDEIGALARQNRVSRNPCSPIGPIGGYTLSQPGTPLFEVAHTIASSLAATWHGRPGSYEAEEAEDGEALRRVLEIIRDPLLLLQGTGLLGRLMSVRWLRHLLWRCWVKPKIDEFISSTLRRLGRIAGGDASRSAYYALKAFLSTLLLAGGDIQDARLDFKRNLRPIILLQPGAGCGERLRDLIIRARKLGFRVIPGLSESDRESRSLPKYLDPTTLVMNINGYPPALDPGFCLVTWEFENGDEWGPLLVTCHFRRAITPGRYDFSIRIKDGMHVDSEHFYRSVLL
ncbi:MAG TPA: hypothetical protein GXX51_10820 [Firmicutes bacterium]|nr:hypothetical protein [Bacillota bacterium]